MATMRTRKRLISSTPPPSPIANAKGLRSAAVDDQILSDYLEKTLQVPDLSLPESYFPASVHQRKPAVIDFPSLISRDHESIRQLLRSAVEFGVFQIIGRGISDDELRLMIGETNHVLEVSSIEKKGIVSKLEAVAKEVGKVFSENIRKRRRKRIQEKESVLCLYRYNHNLLQDQNPTSDSETYPSSSQYALCLQISRGDHVFHVQSGRGSFSFNVGSGNIVVTLGKQLQEWSLGEFKCIATGEPIFDPSIDGNPSLSLRFMCSPSTLNQNSHETTRIISLCDQLLIALTVVFLYNIFTYISSRFTTR